MRFNLCSWPFNMTTGHIKKINNSVLWKDI